MNEKEQLQQKLEELIEERDRILRGFGQRYSRRFKPVQYDRNIHGSKSNFERFITNRTKRTKNNINSAKSRLIQISDEISSIKSKIKELDLQNFQSSSNFNESFKQAISLF